VSSSAELHTRFFNLLPKVQKPGRYTGGELNEIVKDWADIETKIALVFPDIYDLGMSNLALAILYEIINNRPDALAERAFSPWTDMEILMRESGLPLLSLETKHPLYQFDIFAVTLPYETLFTNFLNIIDLAGIPLFSSQRDSSHPLIVAGGHATYNPEPIHAFVDAFVIGEGEEVIHEIISTFQSWKNSKNTRTDLLIHLANIDGIYIPSFYRDHYNKDSSFSHLEPLFDQAPKSVIKRIVAKLPPPPVRFIVPYINTVHNRIPIEIMRGCTRGCRFCHAGMVTRPVRERPIEEILTAIDLSLSNTGYEEIGLLSLSSSDYSQIIQLAKNIGEKYQNKNLSVSLPSLRIETVSVDLINSLPSSHRGGITLAPEAASEKLRATINKQLNNDQLLTTAQECFSRGWTTMKLYFMIGLPGETMDDIQAIAKLCKDVLKIGNKALGLRAQVHASIGTFIPKAHTPFQWCGCETIELIKAKQIYLKAEIRGKGLKITWVDPKETILEAALSRGDRRLAKVIYEAWKMGAKFDAWNETNNFPLWVDAFALANIDPAYYAHRLIATTDPLPWDHINVAVQKDFLQQEYLWSLQGFFRQDCRNQCFSCGVLPVYKHLRMNNPGDFWKCPEVNCSNLGQTTSGNLD